MGIYLNPGNESFQRALRSRIYIDKTELIFTTPHKKKKEDYISNIFHILG